MAFAMVAAMSMGIVLFVRPYAGMFTTNPAVISEFIPAAATLLLQVQALEILGMVQGVCAAIDGSGGYH